MKAAVPTAFEVEVGNRIAYALPLENAGSHFRQLQSQWLPYYSDDRRRSRLAMVHAACLYDLDHIPLLRRRGLHFHAFDRLYKGFQVFLHALFIAHRTYPIAYNMWIREQIEDRVQLPELYRDLMQVPVRIYHRKAGSRKQSGGAQDSFSTLHR
jgi:hypothetical protein